MADIELVIKIPENYYLSHIQNGSIASKIILNAVDNGTPLPKGHGDLITKEQAIELVEFYQVNPQHFDFVNLIDEIKNENPIIPAERSDAE